jgi:branched-chain amino acid transport system substrate-binding protein
MMTPTLVLSSQSGKKSLVAVLAALITLLIVGSGVYGVYRLLPNLFKSCNDGQEKLDSGCFNSSLMSRGERILFRENSNSFSDRGTAAMQAGNWQEAITYFEKAAKSDRHDPEVQIYLNNARSRLQGTPVTIAVIVPIDSRPTSAQEILRGVADAQTKFNTNGIKNQKLLEVIIFNDGNDPKLAAILARKIVSNAEIVGIIGHNSSSATKAALPIYEEAQLVVISPTSTSTELLSKNFYRTVPSDAANGKKLAQYLQQQQKKQVAVFYNPNSNYSRTLQESFINHFESKNNQVLTVVDLSDSSFDAVEQLSKISGIDAIVLLPDTQTTIEAISIAKANQENQKLLIVGGDALYSSQTLELGSKAVNGLVLAVPWFSDVQPYAKQAESRWGGTVNWRTAASFDATQAMLQAIAKYSQSENLRFSLLQNLQYVNLSGTETSGGSLAFISGERNGEPILVQITPDALHKPLGSINGFVRIDRRQ